MHCRLTQHLTTSYYKSLQWFESRQTFLENIFWRENTKMENRADIKPIILNSNSVTVAIIIPIMIGAKDRYIWNKAIRITVKFNSNRFFLLLSSVSLLKEFATKPQRRKASMPSLEQIDNLSSMTILFNYIWINNCFNIISLVDVDTVEYLCARKTLEQPICLCVKKRKRKICQKPEE